MERFKKPGLYLSLLIILGYWVDGILKLNAPAPVIPDSTAELLWRIAINKLIVFAAVYVLLMFQSDNLKSLGCKNKNWVKQSLIGIGLGILTFVVVNIFLTPLMSGLFPQEVNNGPGIMAHFADPSYLWLWIVSAIAGGGFVEEVQRIFVLTRFEKWQGRRIILLILIVDAIVFGISHVYQGASGAVSTGLTGLIFGLIYLRKRSFIEAFAAHAIFDIIGILVGHMLMQQALS